MPRPSLLPKLTLALLSALLATLLDSAPALAANNWLPDFMAGWGPTQTSTQIYYQNPKIVSGGNGVVYMACEVVFTSGVADKIAFFRSTDGGRTWPYGIFKTVQTGTSGNLQQRDTVDVDIALTTVGNRVEGVIVFSFYDLIPGVAIGWRVGAETFIDTGIGDPVWGGGSFTRITDNPFLDFDARHSTCHFTGQYWVISYAYTRYDNGEVGIESNYYTSPNNIRTGVVANTFALVTPSWELPRNISWATMQHSGSVLDSYLSFEYVSNTTSKPFTEVWRGPNQGLVASDWRKMGRGPAVGTTASSNAAMVATRAHSPAKLYLMHSKEKPGGDTELELLTAGPGDLNFTYRSTFRDTAAQERYPSLSIDPQMGNGLEKVRAAWMEGYGAAIRYTDFNVTDAAPQGVPDESPTDLNPIIVDPLNLEKRAVAVSWYGVASLPRKDPIVMWIDARPPNIPTPMPNIPYVWGSYKGDGGFTLTPTPTPTGNFTWTPSPTPTPSWTPTPSFTPSPTPSPTWTPTGSPKPSETPSATPPCCYSAAFSSTSTTTREMVLDSCTVPVVRDNVFRLSNNRTTTLGSGNTQVCLRSMNEIALDPAYAAIAVPGKVMNHVWVLQNDVGLTRVRFGIEFDQLSPFLLPSGMSNNDIEVLGVWDPVRGSWQTMPITVAFPPSGPSVTVTDTLEVAATRLYITLGRGCGGFESCGTVTPVPPTATPTASRTPSPTNTPTATPSPTQTYTPTPTATPTGKPPCPNIYLAGFWSTQLTVGQPRSILRFVVLPDPNIANATREVELYLEGRPTGVFLKDDGLQGDFSAGDGIWALTVPIDSPLGAPGKFLIEAHARSLAGQTCYGWPYLNVY